MTDILPFISGKLSAVARVELQFPDAKTTLPVIAITEAANTSSVVLNNTDRLSDITIQLDIFGGGKTPAETMELAVSADKIMAVIGMRRISANLICEAGGKWRKTMRYRGLVDEISGYVYN